MLSRVIADELGDGVVRTRSNGGGGIGQSVISRSSLYSVSESTDTAGSTFGSEIKDMSETKNLLR